MFQHMFNVSCRKKLKGNGGEAIFQAIMTEKNLEQEKDLSF